MNVNDEPNSEQMVPEETGPGQRLRQAREAAGLSRDEVASRLRLRLELISALEDDDYAHLPPAAYVSGYLRSYARLVDLPAEELVAMLERREEALVMVSSVMPPHQRRSSDWSVKVVTWLIILLLLGLLAAWWFARQPLEQDVVAETPAMVTPGSSVTLSLPSVPDEPVREASVLEPVPEAIESPASPSLALAEVQLEAVNGDCWLQIKDATGNELVYELLKNGTTRTVRGKAPFDIFLGNAPAVTVYYQGKVFEHGTFQRGEVAKFRLGKAADNKPLAE